MKRTKQILLSFAPVSLIIACVGLAPASVRAADTYKHEIQTHLSGSEEVPPVSTSMSGTMTVKIPNDEKKIEYTLTVQNGQDITAAHIHCGPRGKNGPVIVPLFDSQTSMNINGELVSGTIQEKDIASAGASCSPNIRTTAHLVQAMRTGEAYVNVHTIAHPNGEIRGQLLLDQSQWLRGMGTNMMTNKDLMITEMNTGSSTARTFVITISNDMLNRLTQLWNRAVELFPQIKNIAWRG